ncbi:uncharacterized protein LOC131019930 [Salvia miltiorrhiza]|uniref:uncharacterized protein LOC131019930 n=1 Tax=Salvia miltiorrhiza TaxID=226208 RepID=UPI0025AD399B|nr:uncharacterized protein LOC131019930 [Salvia miltiorrhiza]
MIVRISVLILSISCTLDRGTTVALDFRREAPRVWMATPESTAAWTSALLAPRDSAASAHTLVTSAAAEDSTLAMSWHGMPCWNGEPSSLPVVLLILAMAAASCVRERAACSWAVWSRLSSFLLSFLHPNRLLRNWPLGHVLRCCESICLLRILLVWKFWIWTGIWWCCYLYVVVLLQ